MPSVTISCKQASEILNCITEDATRGTIMPAAVLREILDMPREIGSNQIYAALPDALKKGYDFSSSDPLHHTIALETDVLKAMEAGNPISAPTSRSRT